MFSIKSPHQLDQLNRTLLQNLKQYHSDEGQHNNCADTLMRGCVVQNEPPVRLTDVLLGRGGFNNKHRGNIGFNHLGRLVASEYKDARNKDKTAISAALVKAVQAHSGRFLKFKKEEKLFVLASEKEALEKASQLLRDTCRSEKTGKDLAKKLPADSNKRKPYIPVNSQTQKKQKLTSQMRSSVENHSELAENLVTDFQQDSQEQSADARLATTRLVTKEDATALKKVEQSKRLQETYALQQSILSRLLGPTVQASLSESGHNSQEQKKSAAQQKQTAVASHIDDFDPMLWQSYGLQPNDSLFRSFSWQPSVPEVSHEHQDKKKLSGQPKLSVSAHIDDFDPNLWQSYGLEPDFSGSSVALLLSSDSTDKLAAGGEKNQSQPSQSSERVPHSDDYEPIPWQPSLIQKSFPNTPSVAKKPSAAQQQSFVAKAQQVSPVQLVQLKPHKALLQHSPLLPTNQKRSVKQEPAKNQRQSKKQGHSRKQVPSSKGRWSDKDDQLLLSLMSKRDARLPKWSDFQTLFPDFSHKQIRDRWVNHLNPILNHSPFSPEEFDLLASGVKRFGKKWVKISQELFEGKRPENQIKNVFHSASFKSHVINCFGEQAFDALKS